MKYTPWKRPPLVRANRIITVNRRQGDVVARIDLVFYADKIRRFLRLQSRRLRQMLKKARSLELEPVPLPANVEQVVIDSREELKLLTRNGTTRLDVSAFARRSVPAPTQEVTHPDQHREPVVVVGRVLSFGDDQRTLGDKSFQSPYLDLEVDELGGHPRRFWGTDLPRAIRTAGANIGDRIKLKQLGSVPYKITRSDHHGDAGGAWAHRRRYYNAYEIEILNRGVFAGAENDPVRAFTDQ